jgi:flagellin
MVGINTNNNALFASASLTSNQVGQNKAMQQLSTGMRINSSRDDAAGLAISTIMNSSVRGMAVAIRNVNDGISLTQIADNALASVSNSLQHMNELALQAATGTLSDADRSKLQIEVSQMVHQIDTVSDTAKSPCMKARPWSARPRLTARAHLRQHSRHL